jgi:hypothetical protein
MQDINFSSFAFLGSRLSSALVSFLWGASSGTPCKNVIAVILNRCPRVTKKLHNLFIIKDINVYFFLDDSYASTAHSENIAEYTGYRLIHVARLLETFRFPKIVRMWKLVADYNGLLQAQINNFQNGDTSGNTGNDSIFVFLNGGASFWFQISILR